MLVWIECYFSLGFYGLPVCWFWFEGWFKVIFWGCVVLGVLFAFLTCYVFYDGWL